MRQQPFASPEEALKHHGVKGQKWGVRNEDVTGAGAAAAKKIAPGTPEFQRVVGRVTRTDHPQFITPTSSRGSKPNDKTAKTDSIPQEHTGMTRNQKMLLAFGAATAAAAGYYAYKHYTGNTMPGLDLNKIKQEEGILQGMKLPKSWDVSGLKNGPISTQRLGDLAGGNANLKLLNPDNLVINTSRGYADILPKGGFSNPFAAEQHASVTRVLEEMRDKFPTIRNMNVEVVPYSHVPGMEGRNAMMSVMTMRAGEARVMYNDSISAPTAGMIRANSKFLPGLGAKDYIAHHEMGHLLAAAHGELPPTFNLLSGDAGPSAMRTYQKAEPLLHKRLFAKHGFSFKELSKISKYAATEPAESLAELVGHTLNPEMRGRLTADQLSRATAMINEMGGVTG